MRMNLPKRCAPETLQMILILTAMVSSAAAAAVIPPNWGWSVGASPHNDRGFGQTATLTLQNRVLVVGGQGDVKNSTSVEIYDPAADQWSFAAPTIVPRNFHTATLLGDGRVLVCGGADPAQLQSPYDSAETYDSTKDTWTAVANMPIALYGANAVLLSDGRAFIVGGNQCALFDPTSNTWTTGPAPLAYRATCTLTLLLDGRVLRAGGSTGQELSTSTIQLSSCEIYDPAKNAWQSTGSLNVARSSHVAARLNDGRVLAISGRNYSEPGTNWSLKSCEIYDPASGAWTTTADTDYGPDQLAVFTGVTLLSGRVLVYEWPSQSPPSNPGAGSPPPLAQGYDPVAQQWTIYAPAPLQVSGPMTLLSDGRVLIAGNLNVPGPGSGAELFIEPVKGQTILSQPSDAHGYLGIAFKFQVLVDGTPPIVVSALNLPPGLSFDHTTNTISGTPTASGDFPIQITAIGPGGNAASVVDLTIFATSGPDLEDIPDISMLPTAQPEQSQVGNPVAFSTAATDTVSQTLGYLWDFGDGTQGVGATVSHTFTAAGLYNVVMTVGNASNKVSANVSVLVTDGSAPSPGTATISETLKQTLLNSADGSTNVISSGTLKIGVAIAGGVPAGAIDRHSSASIAVGNYYFSARMGDAGKYSASNGKQSASFLQATFDANGKTVKLGSVAFNVGAKGLSVQVSTKVIDGTPSILASSLVGSPTAPIARTLPIYVVVGGVTYAGTLNVTGSVATSTTTVGATSVPLSVIALKGSTK